MYMITEDPPLSELSQEEEVTDRATGHGNDDDEGSQEELPTRQRRKRGSGIQQPSNLRPKRRRQ